MMVRPKLGIKILGLCTLVFALMGIGSSGAQAAATWLVLEGVTVVEKGEVSLETETTMVLHSKIAGTKVLFSCTAMQAVGINLAAAGTTAKGGKIKASGCTTELNETVSASCIPVAGGVEKGVIVSKALHASLVLHILKNAEGKEIGKDELLQVSPDEGETYATMEMGKECSIGTKVPIIGILFLKDCQNEFLVHKEIHLLEEGPLTEVFTISKTEEHKTSSSGSAFARVKTGGVFRSFAGHAG